MKATKKGKNIVGKILKAIFIAIASIIFLIACIIMYKANRYPDQIPDVFGIKPMIVLSGSMESSIHTGDLVFIKIVDPDTLKKNDIIAYREEKDKVITHRIVDIIEEDGEKSFETKGDANTSEDANLVKPEDVEGVYISRISNLGNYLMFLQQPIGLASVLLFILVIGLIWLFIINKIEDSKLSAEDEKERQEFLEYKRMKKQQEEKDKK